MFNKTFSITKTDYKLSWYVYLSRLGIGMIPIPASSVCTKTDYKLSWHVYLSWLSIGIILIPDFSRVY